MSDKDNSYLVGQLLLAMPGMGDPRFHRAVIYVCAHDEKGAMGIVVNHPLPGLTFAQLLDQVKIDPETTDVPDELMKLAVMAGGPVESARGFLLHSTDFKRPDTVVIDDEFSVTGTVDALKEVADGHIPKQMIFALGYAGWSAGQLDEELSQNAWLTAQATPEVIFRSTPDEMWEKAISGLGVDPGLLSAEAGRA